MESSVRGLALPAVILGGVLASLAFAAAIWLAFVAWKQASADHGIVAVGLVVAGCVLGGIVLLTRKPLAPITEESGFETMLESLHRAEDSLKVIRLARGVMGLACAGVVLFWMVEGLELANLLDWLIPSTLLVAAATWLYLPWLASRERAIRGQRSAALQGLKAFKSHFTA
jgi:hypothetical protein